MLIEGIMAAAVVGLTTLTPFAPRNNMRFYLQQNVLCLAYEHPLLLERSRGWTPKNHFLAVENPQRPHPENGGAVTTVEPEDICQPENESNPAPCTP
jgi:hypothetical protein